MAKVSASLLSAIDDRRKSQQSSTPNSSSNDARFNVAHPLEDSGEVLQSLNAGVQPNHSQAQGTPQQPSTRQDTPLPPTRQDTPLLSTRQDTPQTSTHPDLTTTGWRNYTKQHFTAIADLKLDLSEVKQQLNIQIQLLQTMVGGVDSFDKDIFEELQLPVENVKDFLCLNEKLKDKPIFKRLVCVSVNYDQ